MANVLDQGRALLDQNGARLDKSGTNVLDQSRARLSRVGLDCFRKGLEWIRVGICTVWGFLLGLIH